MQFHSFWNPNNEEYAGVNKANVNASGVIEIHEVKMQTYAITSRI